MCLKIAFRQLCVPLCGRFGPDEGGVAGYVDRIGTRICREVGRADGGNEFSKHTPSPAPGIFSDAFIILKILHLDNDNSYGLVCMFLL